MSAGTPCTITIDTKDGRVFQFESSIDIDNLFEIGADGEFLLNKQNPPTLSFEMLQTKFVKMAGLPIYPNK